MLHACCSYYVVSLSDIRIEMWMTQYIGVYYYSSHLPSMVLYTRIYDPIPHINWCDVTTLAQMTSQIYLMAVLAFCRINSDFILCQ